MKNIKKVLGPYKQKTGRRFVIIYFVDGSRKTTAYARWIVEQQIGRELVGNETVDHIDGDKTNDELTNLQILSMPDNVRKSHTKPEIYEFVCPLCKSKTSKSMRTVRHNWKLGKSGPFCSRSCGSKFGRLKFLNQI